MAKIAITKSIKTNIDSADCDFGFWITMMDDFTIIKYHESGVIKNSNTIPTEYAKEIGKALVEMGRIIEAVN